MASNTENLDLLMKNPSTDGADTFNVQTMLNENWQKIDNNAGTVAQTLANILKPTTPPIIGLPSSTTPNDMFNALAHAGDLHVWRKTVVTKEPIPAGYTLGDVVTGSFFLGVVNSGSKKRIYTYDTSPKVGDDGTVYIGSTNTITFGKYGDSFATITNTLPGKFLIGTGTDGIDMTEQFTVVFYIPSDAQITDPNNTGYAYVDKYQPVIGHAAIAAGTTVTYPVSTNRNAYQDGNDAKPAGYTLGEVVTGNFELAYSANYPRQFNVAESVTVDEAGNITLNSPVVYNFYTNGNGNSRDLIKGKFITRTDNSPPWVKDGAIYYIPADAVISYVSTWYEIDRYQPVTGYAAIPANTTIEYLGCLGDKARVQVISYVGMGTYGSAHPTTVTFNFVPKIVIVSSQYYSGEYAYAYCAILAPDLGAGVSIYSSKSGMSKTGYSLFVKKEGKTISFYNEDSRAIAQMNDSGKKYAAIAIG